MEQLIINYFCPDRPVRLLDCNGKDVTLAVAAKKAASLIRLMKRNYPIVLIFDREKRVETSEQIAEKLHEEIQKCGINNVELIIGVPDKMMENWMLADINSVNSYFHTKAKQKIFEGTGGKSQLKQIINPKNYSETQDGPELAKRCDIKTVVENSKSFESFFSKLTKLNCLLMNIE
ncbi:MAG: DUF4276 family protein [Treponema sp.]